jgi:2-octaprenyl-6-methoxyphenol hydroxylase
MKVCIIGNNLSALLLSKVLVNKGIKVELCYEFNKKKTNFKRNYSRTIGLSNSSIDFLKKENILKANNTWNINEIELYRQSQSKKFLNFKSEKCFSIITYKNFLELLEIIINTENSNFICKKYFSNQIKKDYKSFGFTTILTHSKVSNRSAIQHFTNHGSLAFLPVSNSKTSVVFSIFNKKLFNDEKKIIDLIKSFNKKYNIKRLEKLEKFPINLSLSRNYYFKNILSFGENLHKIHPIAGQGFNMTIRDTKELSSLIKENLELGLNLSTVLEKFEKRRKNSNFLFASGINFFHEFFKFTNKYNFGAIDGIFKLIDDNKYIKNKFQNYADKGF